MDENNVIFCEKCYKANEPTSKRCVQCGARLPKNNDNTTQNQNNNTNDSKTNAVAFKFKIVVRIIQFVGYIGALIVAILYMVLEQFWLGIAFGIAIAVFTWFSKLIFEAIAEGLQLLEDIKNKL